MSGSGFSNPIIGGGGALVYPLIRSPNFNTANPSASPSPSWAILKNGLAYFVGIILSGGTITGPDYIINSSGIFWYSGTPAAGNLIGYWALTSSAGTDQFDNAYNPGLYIGNPVNNTPQVALVPAAGGAGSPAELQFPLSPASFFGGPPGIAASSPSNNGQLLISGPALSQVGFTDWVQLIFWSFTGTSPARLDLRYIDANAGVHVYETMDYRGVILAAAQQISATEPGTGTSNTNPAAAETWHQATLSGTWTGSGGGPNGLWYRLLPWGASGTVEIIADIINTTATGNSACFTLPTGYIPATSSNHLCGWNNPAVNNSASLPWINVSTAGVVQVTGLEVANKGLFFHIFVPLETL